MKKHIFYITLFSILFVDKPIVAQSNDTLSYTIVSHIKNSTNFQIGVGLIDYDYQLGRSIRVF